MTSSSFNIKFSFIFVISLISIFILLVTLSNIDTANAFANATDYKFVKKWGGKGSDDGQFLRPHDLDFNKEETILYIVDRDGSRIQAFDKDGFFLFKFGEDGTDDGQMHVPYGIDVDVEGNIWLADRANDRVQKFDSEGKFITKFGGSYGKGDGQFQDPEHLAVDSESNVYVSDRKRDDIQKFAPVID
jgi:tripartite motif-containing protein 71